MQRSGAAARLLGIWLTVVVAIDGVSVVVGLSDASPVAAAARPPASATVAADGAAPATKATAARSIVVVGDGHGGQMTVDPSTPEGQQAIAAAQERGEKVITVEVPSIPIGASPEAVRQSITDALRDATLPTGASSRVLDAVVGDVLSSVADVASGATPGVELPVDPPTTVDGGDGVLPVVTLPDLPTTLPGVTIPSVTLPAVTLPPVTVPPVTTPPVTVTVPSVTVPGVPVTTPPVTVTVPSVTVTVPPVTVTVPPVTLPPVTLPPVTVTTTVTLPPVTLPHL